MGIEGNGHVEAAMILRPDSLSEICLGSDNILLVGEAAGLISPSSAEGISYALRSGKLAAQAINQEYENNSQAFVEYKHKIKPLIDRLHLKFEKSEKIKKHSTRKKFFEN